MHIHLTQATAINTHDVVVSRIKCLQQTSGTPSTPQNNYRFLLWVKRQLSAWMTVFLRDIVERSCGCDNSGECDAS